VTLFVDTSVWSLAFRRDSIGGAPQVRRLYEALTGGEPVYATGLVLQEILQGFRGPKAKRQILERFAEVAFIVPSRSDHVNAANLRNDCRRRGIQVGSIDALLAQLCIAHSLDMLSTDGDFEYIARHSPLKVWTAPII